MSTLRQYLLSSTIESISGVAGVDERLIAVAESQIDSYAESKLNFLNYLNQKAVNTSIELDSTQATFTNTAMTIIGNSYSVNQFQYTIIELLADAGTVKKGTKLSVTQSNNNVLTFDSVTGLNGQTAPVKIYQVGLFPRILDTGNYSKTIPIQVIEAVAWQAVYLKSLSATVDGAVKANSMKAKMQSESIGSNYSYTAKSTTSSKDSVCVQALNLIDSL